jgi:hypothetical protein
LAGFGDIEVRQAGKDANERRAAEGCALWGLQHTTRFKKVSSLHAGEVEAAEARGMG